MLVGKGPNFALCRWAAPGSVAGGFWICLRYVRNDLSPTQFATSPANEGTRQQQSTLCLSIVITAAIHPCVKAYGDDKLWCHYVSHVGLVIVLMPHNYVINQMNLHRCLNGPHSTPIIDCERLLVGPFRSSLQETAALEVSDTLTPLMPTIRACWIPISRQLQGVA